MILTNRLFDRQLPSREAKSIYIFCEGIKREYQYFNYFKEKDSRINIEIYKLHPHENNSPAGLFDIATKCIIKSEDNLKPKYSFQLNDEVWIVLDMDPDKFSTRTSQILAIKEKCDAQSNWYVVQSNPCFEVWLYYHMFDNKPKFDEFEKCKGWKKYVDYQIKGGFDPNRHPVFIGRAITNAKKNFNAVDNIPDIGSTEVYKLSENIYSLMKMKINKVLKKVESQDK